MRRSGNAVRVPPLVPVAIPVFSPEHYDLVMRAVAEDQAEAALSYDQYLTHLEAHESELREQGIVTRRIAVQPAALLAWCERHARPLTREAISLYAADELEHGSGTAPDVPPPPGAE